MIHKRLDRSRPTPRCFLETHTGRGETPARATGTATPKPGPHTTSITCWTSGLPYSGAGHDQQVLCHLDLAAVVRVAAEDEDLALRVRLRRIQQHVANGLTGEEGQKIIGG